METTAMGYTGGLGHRVLENPGLEKVTCCVNGEGLLRRE